MFFKIHFMIILFLFAFFYILKVQFYIFFLTFIILHFMTFVVGIATEAHHNVANSVIVKTFN